MEADEPDEPGGSDSSPYIMCASNALTSLIGTYFKAWVTMWVRLPADVEMSLIDSPHGLHAHGIGMHVNGSNATD